MGAGRTACCVPKVSRVVEDMPRRQQLNRHSFPLVDPMHGLSRIETLTQIVEAGKLCFKFLHKSGSAMKLP